MNGAIRMGGVFLATALLAGCVSSGKFNKLKAEQDRLDAERRKDPGMSWDDRRDRLPVLAVHRLRLLNSAP